MDRRRLAVLLSLVLAACGPREKQPGEVAFDRASFQISDDHGDEARGNTPSARRRAEQVARTMAELDRKLFSGQGENKTFAMTEKFLVYCHHGADGVAFLIHVPQFKRYKDDVRRTLLDAAWAAAGAATQDLNTKGPVRLGVGLRGSLMYGAVAVGSSGHEPTVELGSSVDTSPLFPFFLGPAPAEAKEPSDDEPAAKPKLRETTRPEPPRKPPPRLHVRTLYSKDTPASLIDKEIRAHDEPLQQCFVSLDLDTPYDYVLHLKGDGKVKRLEPKADSEPPEEFTACLRDLSKTWVFPKKELKLTRPETASIRFAFQSEPID